MSGSKERERKRPPGWHVARHVGLGYKKTKWAVKRRFGLFAPLQVLAYRSEGRPSLLRIRGRVVEDRGIEPTAAENTVFRKISNTVKRLESDEVPGAVVVGRYGDAEVRDETDREGFFEIELELSEEVAPGWHEVEVELVDSIAGQEKHASTTAEVLVPHPSAEFAIVSDLDDTVIRTYATETWTKIRTLFAHGPATRSMMDGAAPLYEALHGGASGGAGNPFFYVSLSGWGLYDLFVEFLDVRGFPKGGMYLRDVALLEKKSPKLGSHDHKRETILGLMDDYPELPFVLIGDSGQEDPETYLALAQEQPDRIRAVLVRDVTPPERDREVRRIMQDLNDMGIDAAAAESSISLARAAADFELVAHEAIDEVRRRMVQEGEEGG
ncbi:MAG: App1 family protein [Gemmatimonadota bacterium]